MIQPLSSMGTHPYDLITDLPASVGVLGTADLGYNQASSTITGGFIRVYGALDSMTLIADPLNTGSSVYLIAKTLAQEVVKAILDGLATGSIDKTFKHVYIAWLDSREYKSSFDCNII